jgi:hypothetical protein
LTFGKKNVKNYDWFKHTPTTLREGYEDMQRLLKIAVGVASLGVGVGLIGSTATRGLLKRSIWPKNEHYSKKVLAQYLAEIDYAPNPWRQKISLHLEHCTSCSKTLAAIKKPRVKRTAHDISRREKVS